MKKYKSIALLGYPNSGKTTLFNRLTGLKQKVGNWAGVTVEKKVGNLYFDQTSDINTSTDVIDLPGIQSLLVTDLAGAVDSKITRKYLLDEAKSIFCINVVDATCFERDLYLTHELLELGLPLIVCISKTTLSKKSGLTIDHEQLANELGVPVILSDDLETEALLRQIEHYFLKNIQRNTKNIFETLGADLKQVVKETAKNLTDLSGLETMGLALHHCEGDLALKQHYPLTSQPWQPIDKSIAMESIDTVIADWRFERVHDIAMRVIKQAPVLFQKNKNKIDDWVLHRIWGLPIFIITLYTMFAFSIGWGGVFQSAFDVFSQTTLVDWPQYYCQQWHVPVLVSTVLIGIGKGINTTVTFIPVLFFMFFALTFLEQTGYMVRAALIVDRLMRAIGLSGKAFIPLILGLGCNVPAIMATRTLDNYRDRILTILMTPFMSCGARLAIYAVFVSLFFQSYAYSIVFSLYLIGILVAIFTGWIIRRSFSINTSKPLVIELPRYQWPPIKALCVQSMSRVILFIKRTGRLIVPLCAMLTLLSHINFYGQWVENDLSQSILATIGQSLTFMFTPMGISLDNWPAVIALLSGLLAKEVVVGVLSALYYVPETTTLVSPDVMTLLQTTSTAFKEQLFSFVGWLAHPWHSLLQSETFDMNAGYALVNHFQSQAAAYAYLLFVLLYVPCLSTVAAIDRELTRFWSIFSFVWSTCMAYILSVVVYQLLTLSMHPLSGLIIALEAILVLFAVQWFLKFYLKKNNHHFLLRSG